MPTNDYWDNTFRPEMSRTSTQGNQFAGSANSTRINYVEKWAYPDEQYPKFKDTSSQITYRFGTYLNEYYNAYIPASYMSSISAGDDQPSRVFFFQFVDDSTAIPTNSVGFHFPGRTSLAYDIINHKYI